MIADRPIIGILFMMGFCMLAPMGDAAAKSISLVTPMMMMLLARYAVQFILPIPIIIASRRRSAAAVSPTRTCAAAGPSTTRC